jgi:hypothetical protein
MFNDISFPADDSSVSYTRTNTLRKYDTFKRDRKEGTLYGNNKTYEGGAYQGNLPDCWLIAAIAALGEVPERVHRLFNNEKSIPKNGQLMLKMWAYGTPQ